MKQDLVRSRQRCGKGIRTLLVLFATLSHGAIATERTSAKSIQVSEPTHGVATGDATTQSVVVWARCGQSGSLRFRLNGPTGTLEQVVRVGSESDFTGRVRFSGLSPDTAYACEASCESDSSADRTKATRNDRGVVTTAKFRTAPPPASFRPVRFLWGGDVGGQNVCRDQHVGYAIFETLSAQPVDFFVALGDMIYADDPCRARGRYGNEQIPGPPIATSLDGFRAHWRYNRSDPAMRRFFASTPIFPIWDDHEIKNDAGPTNDVLSVAPNVHLLPFAQQAFVEYNPIVASSSGPLYKRVRWGAHLELFFLDTRSYRDSNSARDSVEKPKSMLGDAQREWLIESLSDSGATWKFIVSSVPLSIPTAVPGRRDGWSDPDGPTGFQQELRTILRAIQKRKVRNLVWITTDVHFAAAFRYRPDPADPSFVFHEIVTGPLNAGVHPRDEFDPSLGTERLFFLNKGPIASFEDALASFNFGAVELKETGNLSIRIANARGESLYEMALTADRGADQRQGEIE